MRRDDEYNPHWRRYYGDPFVIKDVAVDDDAAAMRPVGEGAVRVLELILHQAKIAEVAESPIEIMLGGYLCAMACDIDIMPQFKLERFRYDFAIRKSNKPHLIVLIECDGKEFHSTPEQIANDKLKDEAAARAGMPLVRFTGSEIHRDARTCASIAIDRLHRLSWSCR